MKTKPYHHGNLYQELIDEGIRLVCEEGMDHVSLRKVAQNAGVSPTACYNHFTNKEDLIVKMKEYVNQTFTNVLREAAEQSQLKEKSISIGRAYVEFFSKHPHYMQFIYDDGDLIIELTENGLDGNHPAFQVFREVALQDSCLKGLSEEAKSEALLSMWGMVQGLATMANMKCFRYEGDWGELTQQILIRNMKF